MVNIIDIKFRTHLKERVIDNGGKAKYVNNWTDMTVKSQTCPALTELLATLNVTESL